MVYRDSQIVLCRLWYAQERQGVVGLTLEEPSVYQLQGEQNITDINRQSVKSVTLVGSITVVHV